jgi:hypothetical protein
MPPRKSRRVGSTPAVEDAMSPSGRSPAKSRVTGLAGNAAKHSESYGSPPTSRPMRSNLKGHGNLDQAASHVFAQIREEQKKMAEDRRAQLAHRATRNQKSPSKEPDLGPKPSNESDAGAEEAEEDAQEELEAEAEDLSEGKLACIILWSF